MPESRKGIQASNGVVLEPIRITLIDYNSFSCTTIRRRSHYGPDHRTRRLAHPRCPLGSHADLYPRTREHPPLRRRPAARAGSGLCRCHLLRPAHRLPVEGPGRHQVLPRLHRARPLPGVGRGRRLLGVLEGGVARLRLCKRDRLDLAEHGRLHDQGPPRGGKRPARIPRIGPRRASSAACWSRAAACRWASRWPGPTGPT